jgi:hypothetical protein
MNAEFWKVHTLGLPRWAWAAMLVGGVGLGLYLRQRNIEPGATGEDGEEGYLNSGNLMPPAAPIGLEGSYGGSGGGVGGGGGGVPISVKPPEMIREEIKELEEGYKLPSFEPVELPESSPPPERTVEEPHHNQPVSGPVKINDPIPAPGGGGKIGISPAQPVKNPEQEKKERIQKEQAERSAQEKLEKKRNEINRLQGEINNLQNDINRLVGEIDGLQNHIAQLTSVIQQYPNAKNRGQWENERNSDRSNIDGKRQRINEDQGNIDHKRAEVQFWNNW